MIKVCIFVKILLIIYTVKADEFRKNLEITNNQSIQREGDKIVKNEKYFAKEIMVMQYETDGLSYDVDFVFLSINQQQMKMDMFNMRKKENK